MNTLNVEWLLNKFKNNKKYSNQYNEYKYALINFSECWYNISQRMNHLNENNNFDFVKWNER